MNEGSTTIDKAYERAILTLRQKISDAGNSSVYLFVDPLLADPVGALPEAADLPRVPLHLHHSDITLASSPYMLVIYDTVVHERLINASVRIAIDEATQTGPLPHPRSVCAWLVGQETQPKTLAQQLARSAVVRDTNGDKRLLRYWDPRNTGIVASHSILSELLPDIPTMCWLALDHVSHLQPVYWSKTQTRRRHYLSERQEVALQELSMLNEARAVIVGHTGDWRKTPASTELDFHLRVAKECGLSDTKDIATFVADREITNAPIEWADQTTQVLDAVRTGAASYQSMVAVWDSSTWHAVADQARQRFAQRHQRKNALGEVKQ